MFSRIPPLAVNMTLPAFPAERRAAALLLLIAGACYRSISHARGALGCNTCRKPMSIDGTDRRMDTGPP